MKKEIIFLIILILVAGSAFWGGMKYQQSKIPQRAFFKREGLSQINQTRERIFSGEVILKDEKNLTLKLPDGSTRIVFLSGSTKISKITDGNLDDIEVGKQIIVIGGQTNKGIFLAEEIQLSPRIFQKR